MENLLKVVRDNLADGTIVEIDQWPLGKVRFAQPSFLTIQPAGPWPDVLLFYFSYTVCAQTFQHACSWIWARRCSRPSALSGDLSRVWR